MFFCAMQFFIFAKKCMPVIHTKKLHRHTCHFSNFHWVFLESVQLEMMCKKRMHRMSTLMNHCSDISHLSRCIHENEWSTTFCKWTVITARSFALAALQVKV